ncbi:MAG TPA: DUF4190 domain-containing protein [Amycolatopsis sp.]|uniref:DUF4190 domain-containing protein n=1 Tax=Amycolatopsis nalaikhensis TaxID=715472 RepID=A0ABY8XYU9_9PSEU|nr:DUF4190 domain-containing protein [Amycolatopsis sp. 2-2]WIV60520.1 DUF4190 domain-containing protein [Amycolatopsis sp. 2-2]
MTSYDPYQPDRQLPAPAEPGYPPSAPQYAVQPYVSQPYPAYGPQPVYGAQPYGAYQPLTTSGMAVAGMVVGIIALVTFWVPFVDLLLGFLAIGLSWAGMVQAGRPGYTGKGMGIAGLICGILAVIPALIVMLFFFGLFAAAGTACGLAC